MKLRLEYELAMMSMGATNILGDVLVGEEVINSGVGEGNLRLQGNNVTTYFPDCHKVDDEVGMLNI
jgi:hypothetical protein